MEHAGVDRAVLLETREGEVWLAGEACAGMREAPATNDASGTDAHLGWRTPGAAFCIPLVTNGLPSGCM